MFFLLLICLGILYWLAQSKFGLFIRALREDQDAAAALGVNTTKYKIMLFVITSMMAAAAGAFFAHYIGIISPNNLMILQMSLVVSIEFCLDTIILEFNNDDVFSNTIFSIVCSSFSSQSR